MSRRGRKRAFSEEETSVLLDLWSDDRIQAKFNTSFRHNLIWEDIALRMKGMGYDRSWKECFNRVGNLKKIFARKKRDFEIGVADATEWTYWSHLESLFKKMPANIQPVNEEQEAEDSSDEFYKEIEAVCDDDYKDDDADEDGMKEMNEDGASQMSDSMAVLMEDIDEDDEELLSQQPCIITTSVEAQPSSSPSPSAPRPRRKPVLKKSRRRAYSEDYYIKQLIENDKQMLRNQQRQLQLDEHVSTAAVQFFSVMTEYLNKVNSTRQPASDASTTEPKSSSRQRTPTPGCSKFSSDARPESDTRTDPDISRTIRVVKRLCTTDISQSLKCNGITSLANKMPTALHEETD